eukprot:m.122727 g.122727  ORF g.122727 m.122727 type:complete len:485 (+) comp13741_c0_seq1:130-1584(+)
MVLRALSLSRHTLRFASSAVSRLAPTRSISCRATRSARIKMPTAQEITDKINADPAVQKLTSVFKENQFEIRLVGGAVRDILIGRWPHDYDFATDALPEQVQTILEAADIRMFLAGSTMVVVAGVCVWFMSSVVFRGLCLLIFKFLAPSDALAIKLQCTMLCLGLKHGTVTAIMGSGTYEITTLRKDTVTDGRHADVEYTKDWRVDAERRDLTINAMSMSMDGTIFDYFGGKEDLAQQRIAFVGDPVQRIKEDYLRVLRYFRFHGKICQHNGHEQDQLEAIKVNTHGLQNVAGERIWCEMAKILQTERAPDLMETMRICQIFHWIGLDHVTSACIERHRRLQLFHPSACAALSCYMSDADEVNKVFAWWRPSRHEQRHMQFLIDNRDTPITLEQGQDWLVEKVPLEFLVDLFKFQCNMEAVQTLQSWTVPAFPVAGKDLLKIGVPKGKHLGPMLLQLKNLWKASRFKLSKEELLQDFCVQEMAP